MKEAEKVCEEQVVGWLAKSRRVSDTLKLHMKTRAWKQHGDDYFDY